MKNEEDDPVTFAAHGEDQVITFNLTAWRDGEELWDTEITMIPQEAMRVAAELHTAVYDSRPKARSDDGL